jgi:hypothetical protein
MAEKDKCLLKRTHLIFKGVIFEEVGCLIDSSEFARRGELVRRLPGNFGISFARFGPFIFILVAAFAAFVAVHYDGIVDLVFDNLFLRRVSAESHMNISLTCANFLAGPASP